MNDDWPMSTIRSISAEIERMYKDYAESEALPVPDVRSNLHDQSLSALPSAQAADAQEAASRRQQPDQPPIVADGAEHGLVLAGAPD